MPIIVHGSHSKHTCTQSPSPPSAPMLMLHLLLLLRNSQWHPVPCYMTAFIPSMQCSRVHPIPSWYYSSTHSRSPTHSKLQWHGRHVANHKYSVQWILSTIYILYPVNTIHYSIHYLKSSHALACPGHRYTTTETQRRERGVQANGWHHLVQTCRS